MKRFFLILLPACFVCLTGWAQEEGELESVEIEIINQRQITLPPASRNFEKIPPQPSEPVRPAFEYEFETFSFKTGQVNPAIRPLKLRQSDPANVTGGSLSLGYGNYASTYLEGFVNSRRDRNKLVGAHALFDNSGKGPVDGKNSGSGKGNVSVYANTFSKHAKFGAEARFENRTTRFYGYPAGTDEDPARQSYNVVSMRADVENASVQDFSYRLGGAFSYLGDRFDARETEVDLGFNSAYTLSPESRLAVSSGYTLLSRKDKLVEPAPRSLFSVRPRYEFMPIENLRFSAGFTAAFENDSIDSKNVHVYPDLRASWPLSPALTLDASLTGGIEKVSLRSISNENIWVEANIPLFHTNKLYDLQGAITARAGANVSATAGFSVASLRNWYFFVNTPTDQARFTPLYDRGETERTDFFISFAFAKADVANVVLRGDVFSYSTDDAEDAWHRPTYRVNASARFNIFRKILLETSVIAQGGAKALVPLDNSVVELDPAFDVGLRATYMVSEKFSVFVRMNNLTASEYPVYLYYPARGFQAMGGLTWSF